MKKKNLIWIIVMLVWTLLFSLTSFAEESKQGTYGTLPPLSIQKRIEVGEYSVHMSRTISGSWVQDSATGRWWYRHDDGSYTKNDWEQIGDRWYHFDINGWMQTGWFTDVDDKVYYLDDVEGYMRVQWVQADDEWYYFDEHGVIKFGWIDYKNHYYYCDLYSGVMLSDCWDTIKVDFGGVVRNLRVHFEVSGEADFASESIPCPDLYYTYDDHTFNVDKSNLVYSNSSSRVSDSIINSAHSKWSDKIAVAFNKVTSGNTVISYTDATLSNSVMADTVFPLLAPENANWNNVKIRIGQNFTKLEIADRTKVIEHELGHGFGLSHRYSKKIDSVMYAFAGSEQSDVSAADVNTYEHLYE